ncbi:Lipocalin-like domain-containing protein [Reichenbachiella faecimaris]|uniref:Lipocalin-like domain-containing protein n=1 Tax=Reichenbachiella faecimaris TaxID=692418 RepID=A0A1W2GD79_REIFA|nr:lipocalin family protein [Reichenbachiella faecimaris]SMD34298.1 Lipocalin-like domain-containing protein [Reichenbachiella faecimaris]
MKRYLLGLILVSQFILISCGEDSTESVILGTWLGTNIVREDCDDPLNNGGLNCVNNLDQCFSCIQFELGRDGSYTLTANFEASPNNESGEYEAKNSVIRLKPTGGDAYNLPISNVSESTMTIDLLLTNGCTAVITLKNTDC